MTEALFKPARLYKAADVLARPTPVPVKPGMYAWYFDELPCGVDPRDCHRHQDLVLLYVGISPKEPPTNGRKPSSSTLRKRLWTHYAGNAAGSTLRLTLGCLLASQLGFQLRRVGSGRRYTFTNPGEQLLDEWMADHAFVVWQEVDRPWEAEAMVLSSGLRLPLNLAGNPCADVGISQTRRAARRQADQLEVVADSGGRRRRATHSQVSSCVDPVACDA